MEFCCRYFYIPDPGPRPCSPSSATQAPTCIAPATFPTTSTVDSNDCPYDNIVPASSKEDASPLVTVDVNGQAAKKGTSNGGFRNLLSQTLRSHSSRSGEKKRNAESHPLPSVPIYVEVLPTPSDRWIPPPKLTGPPVPPRVQVPQSVHSSAPVPGTLPANCNIVLFNIGKLVDVTGETGSGSPVFCQKCTAALSTRIYQENKEVWCCDFCGTSIPVVDGSISAGLREDQLYLGSPDVSGDPHSPDYPLLVFCIDTSGSMCVTSELIDDQHQERLYTTRMEAVKSGLLQCLAFLKERYPMTRVSLVTFSDQVVLHGDGTQAPQMLEDSELLDEDYLRSQGLHQTIPHCVIKSLQHLESAILRLEEKGATALGPAALVSIAIASQRPGSKVIICTDGKANTVLGNLEDCTLDIVRQSTKLFYTDLAEFALMHSVVVSVLTIEGTDCSLLELGQLASNTGGKVNIVPPAQLSSEFQSILEDEIIATNVKLKIFLPPSMFFLHEEHTLPILEHHFGSATRDIGKTFEFSVPESKYQEVLQYSELPFQAQLSFILPDGQFAIRILSQKRPVTNESSAAEDTIDVGVLQTHSAQVSALLAMDGRLDEARSLALAQKDLIERVRRHQKHGIKDTEYDEWENAMSPIYEDPHDYRGKDASSSRDSQDGSSSATGVKTFSDEMASMIFRLKSAKRRVLRKLKHAPEDGCA